MYWTRGTIPSPANLPFFQRPRSGLSFRRDTLAKILPMSELIRITSDNYMKFVALGLKEGWMDSEEFSLQRIHGDNAYTNRTIGKKRIVGRTGLLTGICLHEKFPALQPLGKIVFCKGLGSLWATGGIDPDCEQLVESFLGSFALPRGQHSVLGRPALRPGHFVIRAKILPVLARRSMTFRCHPLPQPVDWHSSRYVSSSLV